jgi:hypothetical protein
MMLWDAVRPYAPGKLPGGAGDGVPLTALAGLRRARRQLPRLQ